ncbi:hypothetical protein ENBRE01_2969 [Enteropsectra breve]|nr:hypothetical protein ENBRE01_2969 [Enteropsectra breve]
MLFEAINVSFIKILRLKMKQLTVTTEEDMNKLKQYLANGRYPEACDNKEKKHAYRKWAHKFFFHAELNQMYVKRTDGSLLHFFGVYQRSDKLLELSKYHVQNGLLKRDKLLEYAREEMYSPTAEEDTHVLEAYETCQLELRLRTRPQNRVIYATKPGIRYQADLIDLRHYTDENRGYCWTLNIVDVYSKFWILTIIDRCTRWVTLSILYDIKPESILKCFDKWIEHYSAPKTILSDQGRQYIASEFKEHIKAHGTD